MRKLSLILLLAPLIAFADTPPPNTVKAKMFTGDGLTSLTATGSALDVNITNSGGLSVVDQGAAGSESWLMSVTSSVLPTNACQETGGHLASIDSKLTSPLAVTGTFFQTTQPVSGTFWQSVQPVSGTLTCNAGSGTQAVSLASLPSLAAGANTIGAVNINGTIPISGTVTATNSANGAPDVSPPSEATQIAGFDGTDLRVLKTSATGVLAVDGSSFTQPVSGTFWQATQPVSGTFWQSVQPVSGTFWQATQPVSAASLPLPSGAATADNQTTANSSLSSIDTKTPALGQALAAGSVPVVLTASQLSTLTPLSSVTVSGTVTANAGTGTFTVDASGHTVPVSGTFWQATQPVSAATLPLPSGAATSAKQPALGTAGTASSDVLSVQGIASMTALKVDGSAVTQPVSGTFWQATQPVSGTFWQATQPVSAVSLPLPSGASTSAKQPALGIAGTASSDVITVQGITSMTALKVDGSAVTQPVSGTFWQATQPVSIASLPALVAGSAIIGKVGIDQTTPGTTNLVAASPVAGATDSQTTGTVSTVITLTAPSNAQGFILQNLGTSTANLRYAMGATATTAVGIQLAPGQDSNFVPTSASVSLVSESGTQNYTIQWIAR